MRYFFAGAAVLFLALSTLPTWFSCAIAADGVLSPYPVGSATCLAIEFPLEDGQILTGLRWYNNDGTLPFPRILLMEADPGAPPDLGETGMILQEITGPSLAWGDVALEQPVTSGSGHVHAVLLFPDGETMAAEGAGGGPGIGYLDTPGMPAYVSQDGIEWVRLDPAKSLEFEPVIESAKFGGAPALASLKESVSLYAPGSADPSDPPMPLHTGLRSVAPNPFNPTTDIRFELSHAGHTFLDIYDLRGRRIVRLKDEHLPAGGHTVTWRGVDTRGRPAASGVYTVRLQAGDVADEILVTLVK